jgi:hypothetical protein
MEQLLESDRLSCRAAVVQQVLQMLQQRCNSRVDYKPVAYVSRMLIDLILLLEEYNLGLSGPLDAMMRMLMYMCNTYHYEKAR